MSGSITVTSAEIGDEAFATTQQAGRALPIDQMLADAVELPPNPGDE